MLLYESHHGATNISYGKSVRPKVAPVLTPIVAEKPVDRPVSTGMKIVATGDVNVRSAPGVGSPILGVLKKDREAAYRGEKRSVDGRDWYRVEYKGQNAWVSSKYSKVLTA